MVDISNIKKIAIVGAGTMGHEIAQICLMAGYPKVFLNDINSQALERARLKISKGLEKLEAKGRLKKELMAESLMENLQIVLDLNKAVSDADFVIEAIPEKMDLKQDLFQNLGKLTPEKAILATNTSTMSISEIGAKSGKPDKVVGMHFFTPIVVLQLIEVIKGKETSDETMKLTSTLGKTLPALRGKRVIAKIEKESPGFIVNRLNIAGSMYLNWLLDYAYDNQIPFESIDADVGALGKFGPCAKWDYLGLDTIYNSFKYFEDVLSSDFAPGKVLTMLVKENNLGKKTGKGICQWTDKGNLVDKDAEKANLFDSELFMALQLNEGCRLIEEEIVSNYKIIDDAMLAGMIMPGPFGPGKRNYKQWCKLLNNFADKSGKDYFRPCELMKSGDFLKMRK